MEIDSLTRESMSLSPRDHILQGLVRHGFPVKEPDRAEFDLVAYVSENKSRLPELVSVLLLADEHRMEVLQVLGSDSEDTPLHSNLRDLFRESMVWLQWLMLQTEPGPFLKELSESSAGQRGVCGAVWGDNDIAYRCRTCEHDPTCAICVPCFQNGSHKDHDYSIIYTGGGCCDCGDITAWQREGFCSNHRGAEHIQRLSEKYEHSAGPVFDALLTCWKNRLLCAKTMSHDDIEESSFVVIKEDACELSFVIVEMLIQFCESSECLLSFVSERLSSLAGLLDILVRAESFLSKYVVQKLHELLLKLLGEPSFKYDFAKIFLAYYANVVKEVVEASSDNALKDHPLLSLFSVQIFTVPTLTTRLVKEMNLLEMLMGCLGEIFVSCTREDGQLQITKWANLSDTTLQIVEDIRFVMSHDDVPRYVTHDQRDLSRTWIKLLAFLQGINSQKRETTIHVEDENERFSLPFDLGISIAKIHSLLVDGAFSVTGIEETAKETHLNMHKEAEDDKHSSRHAKVGRLSQESSVCSAPVSYSSACVSMGVEVQCDFLPCHVIPTSFIWLISECLQAIGNWLKADKDLVNVFSPNACNICHNFLALKTKISTIRRGKSIFRPFRAIKLHDRKCQSAHNDSHMSVDMENGHCMGNNKSISTIMCKTCNASGFCGSTTEGGSAIELEALHVLGLSDWPDIFYDVSSQDISVHIPLHRLLSLLLQKALRKCCGEHAFANANGPSTSNQLSVLHWDFFGHMLRGCHPYGFSAFVMEHPLRNRVFCAQVHAGMWRKNGYSALISSAWSQLDSDLDLFLLQCCAALATPDLYVYRIVERFGLSGYLSLDLERTSEYEPVLVQEMLTLLIHIFKERRFCGLTTSQSLRRELVCKLAIGDATHSQLVEFLPRDLSRISDLQEVLDNIALFSNPSGLHQGMYSLRTQYWKELDLYFPRWNSRDLQVVEERYLRFCGFSPLTTQIPKWTKIYDPLKGIARVATCEMVLKVIHSVIFYATMTNESTPSRAPDTVLLTALHLLSLALDICYLHKESSDLSYVIPILALAGEKIGVGLDNRSGGQSLLSLLVSLMSLHSNEDVGYNKEAGNCNLSSLIENLLKKFASIDSGCLLELEKIAPQVVIPLTTSSPDGNANITESAVNTGKHKAKARERQAIVMEKMKAEQSKFLASMKSTLDDGLISSVLDQGECKSGHDPEESGQDICSLCHDPDSGSPVSYLILLQKSRILSSTDRCPPSWEQVGQLGRVHFPVATKRMRDQSEGSTSSDSSEMTFSSHLSQNVVSGQPRTYYPTMDSYIHEQCKSNDTKQGYSYSFDALEDDMYHLIHREMNGSPKVVEGCKNFVATEQSLNGVREAEPILIGKYIADLSSESSKIASKHDDRTPLEVSTALPVYDGFGPSDSDGVFLSSCGHGVHQDCLDRYHSSLRKRYSRRIYFEGGNIVDPDKGEFLCPVCRRLANSVLPTLSGFSWKDWTKANVYDVNSQQFAGSFVSSGEGIKYLHLQRALSLLQIAAYTTGRGNVYEALRMQRSRKLNPNLELLFRMLYGMYYIGKQDQMSQSARLSHSVIMWDTLKYSLISMEIAARCGTASLSPVYDIKSLSKRLKSSDGFILSMLLKTIQHLRSESPVHVLQRFRGILLFKESICLDASTFGFSGEVCRDNMLYILKHTEYPDIQLWKRASDPVLAHDPFSSLMWVLFCLPHPFLSCKESFLCLVHLFYAISITQAIITYCSKYEQKMSKLGLHDCLITDICEVMEKAGVAEQYFVSNYMEPSCDIKDIIRSFSLPYLRRCMLLWNLVNSSTSSPYIDTTGLSNGLFGGMDATMGRSNSTTMEFMEVEKLENMFRIPSLDVVLKDELLRLLASKWFHHFCKNFHSRGPEIVLYLTPAVPFKLMHLPHVYHDLIDRYIIQQCPECEPALCLLCGRLCSPSLKSCCRESRCQTHAVSCGAGTGVFLLIRKTTILLQRSSRQAPWPSLYLDAFGEEDIFMYRGRPLYLNEERYAALTQLVASHGLDQSSFVLDQTTIDPF